MLFAYSIHLPSQSPAAPLADTIDNAISMYPNMFIAFFIVISVRCEGSRNSPRLMLLLLGLMYFNLTSVADILIYQL
jgi:hypothetical protein